MKYILFLSILLSSIHAIEVKNHSYVFTYTIDSSSLGPTYRKVLTVHIKNNQATALNLTTCTTVNDKKIPYITILVDAINKKENSNYNVIYDAKGFPKSIISKSTFRTVGKSVILQIFSYHEVKETYILDCHKLKLEYFEQGYQKWLNLNKKNYQFNYQDNQLNPKYIDGLEITVKDNKIFSLKDIFKYTKIPLFKNKYILNINQWFNLIKKEVKKKNNCISVFYNNQYGYPANIIIQDNNKTRRIYLHSLK